MKYHLRINEETTQHVHFTVFAEGASCGHLCMTIAEYLVFIAVLSIGQEGTIRGSVELEIDKPTLYLEEA